MCVFLLETTGRLKQPCSKGYFTSYCLVGAKAIPNFNSTSAYRCKYGIYKSQNFFIYWSAYELNPQLRCLVKFTKVVNQAVADPGEGPLAQGLDPPLSRETIIID